MHRDLVAGWRLTERLDALAEAGDRVILGLGRTVQDHPYLFALVCLAAAAIMILTEAPWWLTGFYLGLAALLLVAARTR